MILEIFDIQIPFILFLLLVPLIGAAITAFTHRNRKLAKYVATVYAGVTLALTMIYAYVLSSSGYADSAEYAWVDTNFLKISFAVGVDGLSLLMMLLTAALVFLVCIFSASESKSANTFFSLILAMEVGLMGVFMAQDYFLFFIFWEIVLIPMYFLISGWGGPRRHYAAIKFLIYTHVASMMMLVGIFAMAFEAASSGPLDFAFATVNPAVAVSSTVFQTLVFGVLFFGFATKMPLVPFHTWLPDAHVEAPTAGSVLLAGVMLKMGAYGIIRVCLSALPAGASAWLWPMIGFAILAILYGAWACIAQNDLKKMVAFSSISHMGLVLLGIAASVGTGDPMGVNFAIFQMFAHGLISAALFMVCGIVGHNTGTREISLLGGLAGKMPILAAFMVFAFLASLGLPGLAGFVAEFFIMFSFFDFLQTTEYLWLILLVLASLLLTAGYYLWAMQRSIFGKETDKIDLSNVHDVSRSEGFSLGVLCALIALFGILPKLVMVMIEAGVYI